MTDCKCGTGTKAYENVCECGRYPTETELAAKAEAERNIFTVDVGKPKLREPIPEVKRKLASIRTIDAIEPIEGADRIVVAKIGGWSLITQKSNDFKPGDLVCYFEIDSFLPVREEFEFLRKACFKSTKNLGDGFRIKTMKMRGVVSQGLILPLSEMLKNTDNVTIEDGFDLTEILGVQKYEKPIPTHLAGRVRGNFPSWIRKTDQERVQNLKKWLPNYLNTTFEVTKKLDGSSMTIYVKNNETVGPYVGVCSRNLDLQEDDANSFWKVAKDLNLPGKMLDWYAETGQEIAIQGELMGPGVQGNREKFDDLKFFVFDIWDIAAQKYMMQSMRDNIISNIFQLEHAPVVDIAKLSDMIKSPETMIQDLLELADATPSINNEIAEGLVFKSEDGSFSFKAIANRFLLAGGE